MISSKKRPPYPNLLASQHLRRRVCEKFGLGISSVLHGWPPLLKVVMFLLVAACGVGDESSSSKTGSDTQLGPTDLVSGSKYTKIVIEVDSMTQRQPSDAVVTQLLTDLNKLVDQGYLAKPGGVEVVHDDELPPSGDPDKVYTFGQLDTLVNQVRSVTVPENVAVIHVLFVDGHYEDDEANSSVLGYAYGGDTIVMLKDNIQRTCTAGPVIQLLTPKLAEQVCALSEATVWLHEVGHLLGLVNNGLPMVEFHQDTAHGKHDQNPDCIMYWLNERSGVADVIAQKLQAGNSDVSPFDAACLADLAAVSGKK